jgi:hypothetical protein
MKSFADWTREKVGNELRAITDAEAEIGRRAAREQDNSAAAELLGDVSMALTDTVVASSELAMAQRMLINTRRWLDDQGNTWQGELESKLAQIDSLLSGKVAAVLLPLLDEAMQRKAVDDFCLALKQNITPALKQSLVIQAPEAMRELLEQALARTGVIAELEASADEEASAQFAGMVIETNLSEWAARLRELIVT